ncbi:serine hydrolase domain-containing protein [Pseudoalteromonas fenneropenaei]|uniref:Serine hydrolase domain-containing protein n=1 Tax=Pseudoalteromonas fenneropenaei TaxID=1737459 RepID=A0ABV7CLU8_9GAMM
MKTILGLVSAIFLCHSSWTNASQTESPVCDKITPALTPFIEQGIFQGNVLIAKNGVVLCAKSVGFADANKQISINRNTQFAIASLSKPIVASLVLKLAEQGVVDLHSPLNRYLPKFNAPWAKQVTLHHLLANRSGLPSHFMLPGWKEGRYKQDIPQQALLDTLASMSIDFTPGTQYRYTNLGWLLLAEMVETVTASSLEENLRKHIFTPVSMPNSGLVSHSSATIATGFRWGKNGGWQAVNNLPMQILHGGAGIYSTSDDLINYLDALHNGNLLSAQSQKALFSSDSPYGWKLENITLSEDTDKAVHTFDGQLEGHSSFVYYLTQDNVSLILLNNTGMGYEHKRILADDMLRAFYGLPLPNRTATASLVLNRALLDNKWADVIKTIQSKPIDNITDLLLVNDLAKQLDWSDNTSKALDLFAWLVKSYPDNPHLNHSIKNLCTRNTSHRACGIL